MVDNKLDASRNAVQQMLFYHIYAMTQCGVKDPKQVIATELSGMLDLSEAQVAFVKANISNDNKIMESLSYAINLLKSESVDKESITICLNILEKIQQDCKDVIDKTSGGDTNARYE